MNFIGLIAAKCQNFIVDMLKPRLKHQLELPYGYKEIYNHFRQRFSSYSILIYE